MNKIIGIVGKFVGENTFGATSAYMQFFSRWGTPVVISPHIKKDVNRLLNFVDVFVLPGGEDVDPLSYNAVPEFFTGRPSLQLEYFDKRILPLVFDKKPIIGICRGIQTLNVFFGGTLFQDLPYHKRSYNSRTELAHEVKMNNGRKFKVNSLHHQGIEKLGNGLVDLGRSDDGIIEIIRHENLPIFAVQWHPEEILDGFTLGYIDEMLGE